MVVKLTSLLCCMYPIDWALCFVDMHYFFKSFGDRGFNNNSKQRYLPGGKVSKYRFFSDTAFLVVGDGS